MKVPYRAIRADVEHIAGSQAVEGIEAAIAEITQREQIRMGFVPGQPSGINLEYHRRMNLYYGLEAALKYYQGQDGAA